MQLFLFFLLVALSRFGGNIKGLSKPDARRSLHQASSSETKSKRGNPWFCLAGYEHVAEHGQGTKNKSVNVHVVINVIDSSLNVRVTGTCTCMFSPPPPPSFHRVYTITQKRAKYLHHPNGDGLRCGKRVDPHHKLRSFGRGDTLQSQQGRGASANTSRRVSGDLNGSESREITKATTEGLSITRSAPIQ